MFVEKHITSFSIALFKLLMTEIFSWIVFWLEVHIDRIVSSSFLIDFQIANIVIVAFHFAAASGELPKRIDIKLPWSKADRKAKSGFIYWV